MTTKSVAIMNNGYIRAFGNSEIMHFVWQNRSRPVCRCISRTDTQKHPGEALHVKGTGKIKAICDRANDSQIGSSLFSQT